jgi:hypothetical protein
LRQAIRQNRANGTRTHFIQNGEGTGQRPQKITELEVQSVRDEQRHRDLERLEGELMEKVPRQGFKAASTEGRHCDEMELLADSMRKAEEMLAGAKNQSR